MAERQGCETACPIDIGSKVHGFDVVLPTRPASHRRRRRPALLRLLRLADERVGLEELTSSQPHGNTGEGMDAQMGPISCHSTANCAQFCSNRR